MFFPLHTITHFSLKRSPTQAEDVADFLVKNNMSGACIADLRTLSGVPVFAKELEKKKKKAVLGVQIYVADKSDYITFIARNLTGWKKIVQLVSESNKPGNIVDGEPTLQYDYMVNVLHSEENIIVLRSHWDYFAPHEFVKLGLDTDNNKLRLHANEKQLKCVACPDIYYLTQDDHILQHLLLCIDLDLHLDKKNECDNVELGRLLNTSQYYLMDDKKLLNYFSQEEIDRSQEIADLCESYSILSNPLLPQFPCKVNPDEELRQWCRDGWVEKIANAIPTDSQQVYVDRIKDELSILQGAGLSSYFLIVADIVKFIKSKGWMTPVGRGSAAGCLVSYLIGITQIDPIKYNLIFSRFYNEGRNSPGKIALPDIDLDVPTARREEIVKYISDKYGEDRVGYMAAFQTIKGRGAIKDVLRVASTVPFDERNRITANIIDEAKIADELEEMKKEDGEASIIMWALENKAEALEEWCKLDKDGHLEGPLAQHFAWAIALEKTNRSQSKHPAGIIIAIDSLSNICPMIYDKKKPDKPLVGYSMYDAEAVGLMKVDILGINLIDKLMDIQKTLKEEGIDEDKYEIILNQKQ
jgi:DNA polymerase-3 subunit alpha